MSQASCQQPILSCCSQSNGSFLRSYRTRSTLRGFGSSYLGSSSVQDASCSSVGKTRAPAIPLLFPRIRSSAGRRHHRRREEELASRLRSKEKPRRPDTVQLKKGSRDSSDDKVVITLDIEQLKHRAADAVVVAQRAAKRSVDEVIRVAKAAVHDGEEAWRGLRSSVKVQRDKHVVISIRRSSLEFAGKAVMGCILFVAFAKVFLYAMKKYRWGWEEGFGRSTVVVRDRSLAGKEVTLNRGVRLWEGGPAKKAVNVRRGFTGPLDSPSEETRSEKELLKSARARGEGSPATKKPPRLPGWWPDPDLPLSNPITSRQRAEEEAFSLVQGIMQKRLVGFDFAAADIIQLRQLCKESGAKAKFDTYNTRDAFYRAAINFVLSACQGAGKSSIIEFGSEGVVRFIAGLASNIGLESERAATMVNAAVAARTRAGLLQARALRMQSKYAESEEELLRLIRLHSCFPPDDSSAEMEMVARGLGSHFDEDGRAEILDLYEKLGGIETKRVAEEALGLLLSS